MGGSSGSLGISPELRDTLLISPMALQMMAEEVLPNGRNPFLLEESLGYDHPPPLPTIATPQTNDMWQSVLPMDVQGIKCLSLLAVTCSEGFSQQGDERSGPIAPT